MTLVRKKIFSGPMNILRIEFTKKKRKRKIQPKNSETNQSHISHWFFLWTLSWFSRFWKYVFPPPPEFSKLQKMKIDLSHNNNIESSSNGCLYVFLVIMLIELNITSQSICDYRKKKKWMAERLNEMKKKSNESKQKKTEIEFYWIEMNWWNIDFSLICHFPPHSHLCPFWFWFCSTRIYSKKQKKKKSFCFESKILIQKKSVKV